VYIETVNHRLITLTTDFGLSDHFVGVMKGVILGIQPAAEIVDISHVTALTGVITTGGTLSSNVPFRVP
jgi:S-adenosylmethionine hydrolase